jgi:hypothetical protein
MTFKGYNILGVFISYKKIKGRQVLQRFSCLFRRLKVSFGLIFSNAQFYAKQT